MPLELNDAILGYLIYIFFSSNVQPVDNESSDKKRKIKIIHLLPAFMSVFYAYIGTILLYFSGLGQEIEGPFSKSEDISSTLYNLIYFITLILVGTIILVVLIKRKKIKIINIFYFIATFLLGMVIYELYISSLLMFFNITFNDAFFQIIIIFLSIISALTIFYCKDEKPIFLILTFYGGLTGVLFTFMLPLWSIFAISIALALYDLYSVFRGPLNIIIKELYPSEDNSYETGKELPPIRGAIVPISGLNIGLGDIVFYSLIISASILYPTLSYIRGIFVSIAVLIGNYVTLKLLEKYRYLPALPIPLLLGISTYLILLII